MAKCSLKVCTIPLRYKCIRVGFFFFSRIQAILKSTSLEINLRYQSLRLWTAKFRHNQTSKCMSLTYPLIKTTYEQLLSLERDYFLFYFYYVIQHSSHRSITLRLGRKPWRISIFSSVAKFKPATQLLRSRHVQRVAILKHSNLYA